MPQPRHPNPTRTSATVPIVALIALMLAVVVVVNLLGSSSPTSVSAGIDQALLSGQSPSMLADLGGGTGDDGAIDVLEPTAIPTTAPITLPTLAPAVELEVPDIDERADVSAAASAFRAAAEDLGATPTATAPVAQSASPAAAVASLEPSAAPTTAAAVATATPLPAPTATPPPAPTATPEPTATPLPEPTETPQPTAAPLPVGVPPVQATPTAAAAPTTIVASSNAEMERFVLDAINDVRARAGLPPVQLREDISVIARDWSARMATDGFISHRPQAELSAMLPAGWRGWAENVAEAPTVQWAQSALEQSPGHYENMVGQYNVVGVGVVVAPSGQVFVTHNFAQY